MLSQAQLREVEDVWSLSVRNRRALHELWARDLRAHGQELVDAGTARYRDLCRQSAAIDEQMDGAILREAGRRP
jgi:hypothetical protein